MDPTAPPADPTVPQVPTVVDPTNRKEVADFAAAVIQDVRHRIRACDLVVMRRMPGAAALSPP